MHNRLSIILLLIISLQFSIYGQINRRALLGEYHCIRTTEKPSSIDTLGWQNDTTPILKLNLVVVNNFQSKILILKRCGRVKIIDNSPITDLGMNLDNPTIYGKFYIEGDSIVIETKYSIQHFNSHAPKSRVKVKLDKVLRFKILNNEELQVNSNFSWIKNLHTIKNKAH